MTTYLTPSAQRRLSGCMTKAARGLTHGGGGIITALVGICFWIVSTRANILGAGVLMDGLYAVLLGVAIQLAAATVYTALGASMRPNRWLWCTAALLFFLSSYFSYEGFSWQQRERAAPQAERLYVQERFRSDRGEIQRTIDLASKSALAHLAAELQARRRRATLVNGLLTRNGVRRRKVRINLGVETELQGAELKQLKASIVRWQNLSVNSAGLSLLSTTQQYRKLEDLNRALVTLVAELPPTLRESISIPEVPVMPSPADNPEAVAKYADSLRRWPRSSLLLFATAIELVPFLVALAFSRRLRQESASASAGEASEFAVVPRGLLDRELCQEVTEFNELTRVPAHVGSSLFSAERGYRIAEELGLQKQDALFARLQNQSVEALRDELLARWDLMAKAFKELQGTEELEDLRKRSLKALYNSSVTGLPELVKDREEAQAVPKSA